MQIVLDTNVLVSALLKANSTPAAIVTLWREGKLEVLISHEILVEVQRVLDYPHIRDKVTPAQRKAFLALLTTAGTMLEPPDKSSFVLADPDDDKFIFLALAGGAETIVTGDKHLLELGNVEGIAILTPRDFLARWQSSSQN